MDRCCENGRNCTENADDSKAELGHRKIRFGLYQQVSSSFICLIFFEISFKLTAKKKDEHENEEKKNSSTS